MIDEKIAKQIEINAIERLNKDIVEDTKISEFVKIVTQRAVQAAVVVLEEYEKLSQNQK